MFPRWGFIQLFVIFPATSAYRQTMAKQELIGGLITYAVAGLLMLQDISIMTYKPMHI